MTSAKWWYGIALSLACWLVAAVVTEKVVPYDSVGNDVIAVLILFAWVLMPVATYLDIRYVREHGDWNPRMAFWVLASLIWLVNIFTGFSYLARRYRHVGL